MQSFQRHAAILYKENIIPQREDEGERDSDRVYRVDQYEERNWASLHHGSGSSIVER